MIYNPDSWVILEFNSADAGKVHKVFAGWRGGYMDGESWKLNSGIVKVTETEKTLDFIGESGSTYRCHKDGFGMSFYMQSILASWVRRLQESGLDATIEVIDYDKFKSRTDPQ